MKQREVGWICFLIIHPTLVCILRGVIELFHYFGIIIALTYKFIKILY